MNIRLVAVAVLLLVALVVPSRAQVVVTDRMQTPSMRTNVFGLGFAGGPATGLGISFRHHLPSPFSYSITGGIIKASDKLLYSLGAEGQYDLSRSPNLRFFAVAGLSYFYSGTSGHNDMTGPGRVGVGAGAETELGSGVHILGDLAFTYFTDGTVLPLPQLGIYYYFY